MKNRIKQLIGALVLFFFITAASSCNRGLGCPNNFSIGDFALELLDQNLIQPIGLE